MHVVRNQNDPRTDFIDAGAFKKNGHFDVHLCYIDYAAKGMYVSQTWV